MLSSPHNSIVLKTKAHLEPNLGLGSASTYIWFEEYDIGYICT
jgi:hypothetical protein